MCLAKLDTAAEKLKDKTDEVQRLSVGIADAEDKGGREKIKNLEKEIADLDKRKRRPKIIFPQIKGSGSPSGDRERCKTEKERYKCCIYNGCGLCAAGGIIAFCL